MARKNLPVAKPAVTATRVAKAARHDPQALERVVMVQEAQIRQLMATNARIRKANAALKAALVEICITDHIDPDTGEVYRMVESFGG